MLRPPALIAVAFWLGAPLPVLVPDRSGGIHFVASTLLIAIGAALALGSFRRPRARLEFDQGVLRADDRSLPLREAREIVLTGSSPSSSSQPALESTYRAELTFANGERELLLECSDPARVLRDLSVLLPRLKLPVRRGWGLPEGACPWQSLHLSGASAPEPDVELEPIEVRSSSSDRRPALALILGAIALGVVQAILITSAVQRDSVVSALSLGLSLASVAVVLSIGLFVWSRRLMVTANRHVAIRVRVLGIDVRKLAEAGAPVVRAWPVSPDGRTPRHVLIVTEAGPISVPCEGEAALVLADKLLARAASPAV